MRSARSLTGQQLPGRRNQREPPRRRSSPVPPGDGPPRVWLLVLTTTSDGHDHAMTADTLTSVSLDPILVLVCVENETRGWLRSRRRGSSA